MTVVSLDEQDRRELLDRFLRYVQIDTQSDENASASPSTEKQKELARVVAAELLELGVADARADEWGYVWGSVEGNGGDRSGAVPTIGLIAHLDTYFGTPGGGVKPQVISSYPGGDITLPGDPQQIISVQENPNLQRCVGDTIVTSDGTTLLGADDKAGIAEIVTVVAWLKRHPEFPHGAIRIAFTTDEEVGRGTEHFDVQAFGADFAYTLDGSDLGEIEDETFCADTALVSIQGHDVHPGYAKGKMINAVRVAAALIERLPVGFLPETTEGRESYLHPYDFRGDVSKVDLKLLVRAFSEEELGEREDSLRAAISEVEGLFPSARIALEVKESYRNMAYRIAADPRVVDFAFEAVRRLGIEPRRRAIRGGTDGARLSFTGLLTPNIWAGGQAFHSVREWVSLEWMAKAVETTLQLLNVWVERSAPR